MMRTWDTAVVPKAADVVGAFAALLFACNIQMITFDRTARMYSPMLAAILAQMFFFVRAHRRAGILNWTAAAIFTVLAVACNYTSAIKLSVARPAIALVVAAMLIAPLAAAASRGEIGALHAGVLGLV